MVVLKVFIALIGFYGVWKLCGLVVDAETKGGKAILVLFSLVLSVILGQFLRNGVF